MARPPRIVVIGGVTSTSGPAIVTSDDAATWTAQTPATSPVSAALESVTHGDNKFIATNTRGDSSNNTQHSPDAITWTLYNGGTTKIRTAYGKGEFVSVWGNQSFTSTDGLSWTTHTSGGLPSSTWSDICYGNGLFVAVGSSSFSSRTVASSPDGITWTTYATTASWATVTYGNGLFVATLGGASGQEGDAKTDHTITSTDGVNWTARNSYGGGWSKSAFGNGLFVAVGAGFDSGETPTSFSIRMTSTDGASWSYARKTGIRALDLAFGAGVFIAVDDSGNIHTSANGTSWSTTNFSDRFWRGVDVGPRFGGIYVDGAVHF